MCQDCSDSHNNEMHTPDTIGQDPNRARQLTQHMRSPSYKIGGASHAILLAAIHCNVCCSHTRAQINQLCQGTLDPPPYTSLRQLPGKCMWCAAAVDCARMLMLATEPHANKAVSPAATMCRLVMQTNHPQIATDCCHQNSGGC